MTDDTPLTEKERAFCRRHVLRGCTDPIGAFLDVFGQIPDELIGGIVSTLLERDDIKWEIFAQQRFLAEKDINRTVMELEEARLKALTEPIGAMDAAQISLAKAHLLGLVTVTGGLLTDPVAATEAFTADAEAEFTLPGETKPATVH